MSIRSPPPNESIRKKRRRAASHDSIERRQPKKAKSAPLQLGIAKDTKQDPPSSHHKIPKRRGVTNRSHDSKQDSSDHRSQITRSSAVPAASGSASGSSQLVLLTKEALHQLNESTHSAGSQNSGMSSGYEESLLSVVIVSSINAYDPEYVTALKERGIHFADGTREDLPRGLDELWKAILAPSDNPEPNDSDAESLRQDIYRRDE